MNKTTRRNAIVTLAAAATVAVTPAHATNDDSHLLSLTAEFQRLYAETCAAHLEHAPWEQSNALHLRVGETCREIFATPAQTIGGAWEKLKIVDLMRDYDDGRGACPLACFQPEPGAWTEAVVADLERLAHG